MATSVGLVVVALGWLAASGALGDRVIRFTDGAYSYLAWAVDRRGPGALYDQLALSQPPATVLAGALAWHLHAGLGTLRLLECGIDAVTAALTFLLARQLGLTWRVAVGAALLAMTAPLRNLFGGLDGELLVTPIVLGATIAALRSRWIATGILVGSLALVKLTAGPFAIALGWMAHRAGARPVLRMGAASIATALIAWGVLFVTLGWSPHAVLAEVVGAQGSAGLQPGTWALLIVVSLVTWWPLLAPAVVARETARPIHALLLAGAACLALMAKSGTYFNVLAPAEPLLAILAAAGIARLLSAAPERRPRMLGWLLVALLVVRAGTIAAAPLAAAVPFPIGARLVSLDNEREADVAVRVVRQQVAPDEYAMVDPLVALRARRREAEDQADWFILHALGDRCVVHRSRADLGGCVTWPALRDEARFGGAAMLGVEPNVWAFDSKTRHPDPRCFEQVVRLRHGPFSLDLWRLRRRACS